MTGQAVTYIQTLRFKTCAPSGRRKSFCKPECCCVVLHDKFSFFLIESFSAKSPRQKCLHWLRQGWNYNGCQLPQRDNWSESRQSRHGTEEAMWTQQKRWFVLPGNIHLEFSSTNPISPYHQHIINPHTSPLLKEPMNARLRKQYGNSVSDKNIGSTIHFFLICHVSCLS